MAETFTPASHSSVTVKVTGNAGAVNVVDTGDGKVITISLGDGLASAVEVAGTEVAEAGSAVETVEQTVADAATPAVDVTGEVAGG